MTFATEMIVKASLNKAKLAEVPIILHPDGRKAHPPHLKTFRDGWRTLVFLLMYSPRWLFLIPGSLVILLGLIGYALALPGVTIGGATFDAHTLLFSSVAIICGYQGIVFAVLAQTFSVNEGLMPETAFYKRFYGTLNLERGLLFSIAMMLAGLALLGSAVAQWWSVDFGSLDYAATMRMVIPGATLTALGFETVLASFFASILGMKRV